MIELHQFPTGLGVPNLSPFCLKVETWLKLAGLPYEIRWQANPRKGPLGKLPYVRDGDVVVADSHAIVERLTERHGVKLDAQLTSLQRAIAHAFERMLAEHTYWAIVHSRWIAPAGWERIRPVFFGALPAPVRGAAARFVRGKMRRDLLGHGLGRHDAAEIYRRAAQDVRAVADYLADKPWFMGPTPTSADASVYGFLANAWEVPIDSPLKTAIGSHPNLIAYCERVRQRCFAPAAAA